VPLAPQVHIKGVFPHRHPLEHEEYAKTKKKKKSLDPNEHSFRAARIETENGARVSSSATQK